MKNYILLSILIILLSFLNLSCSDQNAVIVNEEESSISNGSFDLSVVANYKSNLSNFDSTVNMNIRYSGDTVFYNIEHLSLDSSEEIYVYDHSQEVIDSIDFTAFVPNNGFTYWIIPFDENMSPTIISGAGNVVCTCSGGGECCTALFSGKGYYCQSCDPNPCSGLCEVNYLTASWQGVGVIVKADQVIYD